MVNWVLSLIVKRFKFLNPSKEDVIISEQDMRVKEWTEGIMWERCRNYVGMKTVRSSRCFYFKMFLLGLSFSGRIVPMHKGV